MDSPPTSSLSFLTPQGAPLAAPPEWTPALIEVHVDPSRWRDVQLSVQGVPQSLYLKMLDGKERVLAEWPRSGTGNYRLTLTLDKTQEEHIVTIWPRKMGPNEYADL